MANVLTPPFRVSYPKVFKPEHNKLNDQMEYSIVALFRKGENLSVLEAAIKKAAEDKWGLDKTKWPKGIRNPLRDQAEKEKDVDGKMVMPPGHEKGAMYLQLRTKQKPGVVNQQLQEIIDPTEFYAGCWARASLSVYAYDQVGNRGVNFGLQHLQKVKDGEPFGGRTRVEDAFSPVDTDEAASNATNLFD